MTNRPASDSDSPAVVLRQVRERFIERIPGRCAALRLAADTLRVDGAAPELDAALRLAHQLAGIGATVGFPRVSASASDLEQVFIAVKSLTLPQSVVGDAVAALESSFSEDLAEPPPEWLAIVGTGDSGTVLVVEDDPEQLLVLASTLRSAGFRVVEAVSGEAGFSAVQRERPSIVLLDVELPGVDGYTICTRIKATPGLATLPVVLLTTRTAIEDRLTGLTLGADDYLLKPLDPRELVMRMRLLLRPRASARSSPVVASGTPSAAPRVPSQQGEVSTPAARASVLLADDDPDVVRIVDSQMRAAGYATQVVFDGAAAVAAVIAQRPDVLVLDLMMPKMTGFDVLAKLRELEGRRPKVLVLSARGREDDVIRAFDVGADDYMTKPFRPQELMARVARLLR